MMKWLLDNKEWVFSGIGVLVISIIWTEFVAYRRRNIKTHQSETINLPQAKDIIVSNSQNLSINEILKDIYNQPPYQQDQKMKDYLGVKIRFSGVLKYVWKRKKGIIGITLENPKEQYPTIHFEISINEHPEFKTMREGTPLAVEGTLTKIDFMRSDIKNVRFIN